MASAGTNSWSKDIYRISEVIGGKAWANTTYRITEMDGDQLPGVRIRQPLLHVPSDTLAHVTLEPVEEIAPEPMNNIATNHPRPTGMSRR